MPSLQDSFFERAVIYICEHDNKGAMGLVINQPFNLPISQILQQMDIQTDNLTYPTQLNSPILIGGPVSPERGFILHTPQPFWSDSYSITDELMLTTSRDILSAIGGSQSPSKFLVALGYAGWGRHQLEQEIADNTWLTIPATNDILFDTPIEDRWQQTSKHLGFDVWQLSSQMGHA